MPYTPVVWFELYVQDMARARAFYETVLGGTLAPLSADGLEMWSFPVDPESPGCGGALVKAPPGMPSGGNSTLVYFGSEDCAVPAGRVEAAGGQIVRPKFSIGEYGFVALAKDPDGNMFGLHSMV